jgi:hypothetical protein
MAGQASGFLLLERFLQQRASLLALLRRLLMRGASLRSFDVCLFEGRGHSLGPVGSQCAPNAARATRIFARCASTSAATVAVRLILKFAQCDRRGIGRWVIVAQQLTRSLAESLASARIAHRAHFAIERVITSLSAIFAARRDGGSVFVTLAKPSIALCLPPRPAGNRQIVGRSGVSARLGTTTA